MRLREVLLLAAWMVPALAAIRAPFFLLFFAASAAAAATLFDPLGSDSVEAPYMCGSGAISAALSAAAAAAGGDVAATPSASELCGVSADGIHFIPTALTAEEALLAAGHNYGDAQVASERRKGAFQQPSAYTASILFIPGMQDAKPAAAKVAARETGETGNCEEASGKVTGCAADCADAADAEACCRRGVKSSARVCSHCSLSQSPLVTLPLKHEKRALTSSSSSSSGNDAGIDHLCLRGRAPMPEERRREFLSSAQDSYSLTIEKISHEQLKRLKGQIYADYAGSGVYTSEQLQAAFRDLSVSAFGNAHSRNPSATLTNERTNEARRLTLHFFGAREDEYAVVFTSGATAAIKLVGEDFPFSSASVFAYLRINHNSVLGIREFAYAAGVKEVLALSELAVERRLRQRAAEGLLNHHSEQKMPSCLFAFPLKDNFIGATYPLRWIEQIHRYGLTDGCRWMVLLDAAAAAPTTPIQLSGNSPDASPDFVAFSFYKIFGFPTGLGALLLKRSAAEVLRKVYWGGGSVSGSLCDARWQKPKNDVSARLEDGTVNFLSIAVIKFGFEAIQTLGIKQIELHVAALTRHLYRSLNELKHRNNFPFALLYWKRKEEPSGGIVTFNLLKPDGSFVPFGEVEAKTADSGIHIRTGCFCNPGGCQDFLGLTGADIVEASRARESCSDPTDALLDPSAPHLGHPVLGAPSRAKAVGAVRISLGYLSTFHDVDALVDFLVHNFLWQ